MAGRPSEPADASRAPATATRDPAGAPAPTPTSRARRLGLFLLAFGSGFAVLAIEIAGARMIAPVFGLSAVPWTAVIGVILAALAVGSHFGGRLADEGRVPLSVVLLVAGATGAIPVIGGAVPWLLRDLLGFVPGAVASAMVLFAPAVLCLGAVVPYLVKADTESLGTIGRRAGDLSAAATAGSIAGSFATGFVLLPAFPLPVLMAGTAAALFGLAALATRLVPRPVGPEEPGGPRRGFDDPSVGALALGALALGAAGWVASTPAPGVLHQEQTLYASVQVTERAWRDGNLVRELWQNGGSSSAEHVENGTPAHAYARASLELLEPTLPERDRALVLGGAALTLPSAFLARAPGLRVDVVEIDPAVTELAFRYFAAGRRDGERLTVVHDDARVFLRSSDASYDLIYLDVFDHLLTVPWTMLTREAMGDIASRLDRRGLFVANVLSPLDGPGLELLQRIRSTLGTAFPAVSFRMVEPHLDPEVVQNLLLIAAHDPVALEATATTSTSDGPSAERYPVLDVVAAGRPFTDAWAPVEYLQARIFLRGLGW